MLKPNSKKNNLCELSNRGVNNLAKFVRCKMCFLFGHFCSHLNTFALNWKLKLHVPCIISFPHLNYFCIRCSTSFACLLRELERFLSICALNQSKYCNTTILLNKVKKKSRQREKKKENREQNRMKLNGINISSDTKIQIFGQSNELESS